MKKTSFKPSSLQILYLIIYIILFGFIIYTPTLINGPVHLSKKLIIEEETFEGILIAILFLLSIWIFNLYKHELFKHKEEIRKINHDKKKVEERLNDSDHYIGMVNVQIQEINTIFNNFNKYPETKTDLKDTFRFFGERVIAIVNTDWVLFRIINRTTLNTIFERVEKRQGSLVKYPCISNKMIIEKQSISSFTSVLSNPQNLDVLVFGIIPVEKISKEQLVFVQAIINEITKMFVILNSSYYTNGKEIFSEKKPKTNNFNQMS